jgi:hypothetical protein
MKLTLNRREEKEGLIMKSPVYYLDVNLEATPDEMALIKKHKWDERPICKGVFKTGAVIEFSMGHVVGKPRQWGFKKIEHLAHVEREVIESARKLKANLEAASGFASGGPHEVEL